MIKTMLLFGLLAFAHYGSHFNEDIADISSRTIAELRWVAHAQYLSILHALPKLSPIYSYPLPLSYKYFSHIRIKHLKSAFQEGGSCGVVCHL